MFQEEKKIALDAIREKASVFTALSDRIWEYAELSLKEYNSAAEYKKLLSELGFSVEENIAGMETAFLGRYGHGRPVIGILGEFDALSGLSQEAGAVEKKPREKGGNGHGCGHNLLGAGALAAAYGVKAYLEKSGREGTVIFFGTPGEEGGAGKAFMAREGIFHSLDCALTWHPDTCNEVTTGTCNSCLQTLYKFKGVSAHAAADPEMGRSALDAVELMNVGVQYLREHMKSDARIHYAMIDGGGVSPNVVQPTASVLYMVRSVKVKDALALQERVDDIARGAALMTGTHFDRIFIDGCSCTVPNHILEKTLYRNFLLLGTDTYTEEEWAYARALHATCPQTGALPTLAAEKDPSAAREVARLSENGTRALNDFLSPLYSGDAFEAGSTDVGDVSWQTPTAQLHALTFVASSPGHSWQNVSCGKTSIAHKGMLRAGSVLAASAVELLLRPELLIQAREEFFEATKSGYVCPIPAGESPKIVEM